MKYYVIFILFSCFSLKAQTNIDFENGQWLILANESDMVTKDTITLIKIVSYVVSNKEHQRTDVTSEYGNGKDNSDLHFRKGGILLVNYNAIKCGCKETMKWKWRYTPATEILNLDIAGKQKNKFKLLKVEKVKEQWKSKVYKGHVEIVTVEGDIEKYIFIKQNNLSKQTQHH
jgi:hypothetical protein